MKPLSVDCFSVPEKIVVWTVAIFLAIPVLVIFGLGKLFPIRDARPNENDP